MEVAKEVDIARPSDSQRTSPPRPYRQRLKQVGRYLDEHGSYAITILEVDEGLIVRANRHGSRDPELIEFSSDDALPGAKLPPDGRQMRRRLFPEGYTPFLEALGQRLDLAGAAAITITEATDFVVVGGIQLVQDDAAARAYEPLEILLLPQDIINLIEHATRHPATSAPAVSATATRDEQPPAESALASVFSALGDAMQRAVGGLRSPQQRAKG